MTVRHRMLAAAVFVLAAVCGAVLMSRGDASAPRPIVQVDQVPAHRVGREMTISDLVVTGRRLTDEGRYRDALGVVHQILILQPRNEYALGVRPLLEDKAAFAAQREARQRRDVANDGAGQPVPADSAYPSDWPDLRPLPAAVVTAERSSSGEERAIQAQLDRKITEVNFPGIAFADAIEFLRDVSGTNIFVNWKSLESAGINRNTPITARLTNVRFSKALDVVLKAASAPKGGLAFNIEDGVITITTEQDLARNTTTRVYDVRDLIPPVPGPAPRLSDGSRNAAAEREAVAARTRRQQAVDGLVASLQQQVDPAGWRDAGGITGAVKELSGQLIVTQTPENHVTVAAFLEQARRRRTFAGKVSDVVCWAAPVGLLGVLGLLAIRRGRGARWRAGGRCRKCGYDLRASVGRCPECGTEIPTGPEPRAAAAGTAAAT